MYPSQVELLQHILDECNYLIREYDTNNYSASSKVHPDLKAKYYSISWREMSDLRNRIIHHYFGIDYDIIWDTIKTDIPLLKEGIEKIFEDREL